ncbi:MAG TPA: dTDP-4-dehydrorhamnose reductase [Patescibacteria group bacterium]|nr:dTDP-4-dehydrorhamnose reductase [Patescibacteria group bacterium]
MCTLILGSKGMLGQELVRAFFDQDVLGWDRDECDLLDEATAREKILSVAPSLLINAIGYNDVDKAEGEGAELARKMNVGIPAFLSAMARELDIPFVHYGTDYVFDGAGGNYGESDQTNPLSVYGRTKRDGELAALSSGARAYVIRPARLFGKPAASATGKKSFVDVMLDLSTKRDFLDVVADEIGSPTYAPDLACLTRELVETRDSGLYHGTNAGSCSWFTFAQEIFRLVGRDIKLNPVPSSAFPRPAKRPPNTSLRTEKGLNQRSWQEALVEYLS